MSSWTELYTKLHDVDRTIINKLEVLLTNQEVNDAYLEHGTSTLLEEPLVFLKTENFDFTEMPREALLQIIEVLKEEKNQMASLFNQVNNERKTLRAQNFKLMERLFAFENFQIEKFDLDFNAFLSRSMFLQYELTKKFLEREREKVDKLEQVIDNKNRDIFNLKGQISQLESKVVQAREMWKKSILETPSAKPSTNSKISTPMSQFESTTDSAVKSPHTTMNKLTNHNLKPSSHPVENELEASINDKIQNKIKELMGGKQASQSTTHNKSHDRSSLMIAIPDDDEIHLPKTSTNQDLLTRSVTTSDWEHIMKSESSPTKVKKSLSPVPSVSGPTPNRTSFGRQSTLTTFDSNGMSPHHQHTKTPSFIKPTESHLARLKQKNNTTGSGSKTGSISNGKTLTKSASQKGFQPLDSKKKLESKVGTARKEPSSTKNGPSLSFLLDQNVSSDSFHLNVSGISNTLIRELDELDNVPKSTRSTKNGGLTARKQSEADNSSTSTKGDSTARSTKTKSTINSSQNKGTTNGPAKKVEKK